MCIRDRFYAEGQGGLPKDEAKALEWYRKAANQESPLAQVLLGLRYATGRGVPRDDRQAFLWFEKAANYDLPLAQYGLGMLYVSGQGVIPDGIKAHQWLDLAAAGGYAGATQPLAAVADQLTEADRAQARQLASQWRSSHARDAKPN